LGVPSIRELNVFPFRLASGMYVSASDEGAVLLDLKRDAYVGFDAQQSYALSAVVENWPGARDGERVPSNEAWVFAQTMESRGLLASTSVEPFAAHPRQAAAAIVLATGELMPCHSMKWRHCHPSHLFRFLRAVLTAWLILKVSGLPGAVERARARRAAHSAHLSTPADAQTVQMLVSAWFHLRSFFYAPKGRCLLDSVALLEFLAGYRAFPSWFIGVQIRPFAAHSWLQADAAVLNGTADFVRAYQPILVI
jgi:hypothetical protein